MADQNYERFLFPERFLSELLRRGAQDRYLTREEHVPTIFRAVVVAVDVEGGKLENPSAEGSVTHDIDGKKTETKAIAGPENPRNSIKARIISNGLDQFSSNGNLKVFWPLFSDHNAIPVKPGEHVYVMFEDPNGDHGLWVNRVAGHEGANLVKGEKSFKVDKPNRLASLFSDDGGSADEDSRNTDAAAGEASNSEKDDLSGLFGG